jgi:hypothetical protein
MNCLSFIIRKAFFAHLLVPFWKDRRERRLLRNRVMAELCESYVSDLPFIIPQDATPRRMPREYVFSIWLQGEEQAPRIVKSCWDSIRRHCNEELVILDAKTIPAWIDLPAGILAQWQSSRMKPCHFTDICRLELLWKYGGYWMDATDYMCHPVPEEIASQPFFLYMGDKEEYSPFVQNCFIRAYAHHPIIGAWKEMLLLYWERHSRAFDYFLPHRLLRHVVMNDSTIAALFAQMPHICHNCTHTVRWGGFWEKPFDKETFSKLAAEGAFQKLEYKSASARNPEPGTLADYFVNGRV